MYYIQRQALSWFLGRTTANGSKDRAIAREIKVECKERKCNVILNTLENDGRTWLVKTSPKQMQGFLALRLSPRRREAE